MILIARPPHPDWNYWLSFASVSLDDFVLLTFDYEPRRIEQHALFLEKVGARPRIEERRAILLNHWLNGILSGPQISGTYPHVYLYKAIEHASKCGMEMPQELAALVKPEPPVESIHPPASTQKAPVSAPEPSPEIPEYLSSKEFVEAFAKALRPGKSKQTIADTLRRAANRPRLRKWCKKQSRGNRRLLVWHPAGAALWFIKHNDFLPDKTRAILDQEFPQWASETRRIFSPD